MQFTEDWYNREQLGKVAALAKGVTVAGLCIEIGVWEGRSALAIAQAIHPRTLHAVDTWRGNEAESILTRVEHPSVTAAKERDVYATFLSNVRETALVTQIDIAPHKMHWYVYRATLQDDAQVAFLHIDANHDYYDVHACLVAFTPLLASGAVICGDDFQNASAQRSDLHGGVERAVREMFGDSVRHDGNLWWVQR